MRTIKIYLIISLTMIMLHSLNGQNTIDYWDLKLKENSIKIETCNNSNQITSTKTISINNNTFTYNNMLVYVNPDTYASYPQGDEALFELLKNNLKVVSNRAASISAVVCLIISNTGKIVNVGIARSSGKFEFDLMAVEFLKNLSPWTPAYKDGNPVNMIYHLPLTFYRQ